MNVWLCPCGTQRHNCLPENDWLIGWRLRSHHPLWCCWRPVNVNIVLTPASDGRRCHLSSTECHTSLPKGECYFGHCCCCAQFSPHFTATETEKIQQKGWLYLGAWVERHPSDFFPSSWLQQPKASQHASGSQRMGLSSESGHTLGSRPELPNPTATTRRCSESNQDHSGSRLSDTHLCSTKDASVSRTTGNAVEHFTLDVERAE